MPKKNNQAVKVLQEGGVILYPTEGVYGLGCDPFNETAVLRLLKIKRRSVQRGLILIAASWEQVQKLIKLNLKEYPLIKKLSPPTTWVFPVTKKVPKWITGRFNTVAIRVTPHPIAKKLCEKFGPIVSTSANLTKQAPITKLAQINNNIINGVDFIVHGAVGRLGKPTRICEIKDGKMLRI